MEVCSRRFISKILEEVKSERELYDAERERERERIL